MKQSKNFINLLTILLIIICIGISLYFRIVLPYDKIFTGEWIKFSGTDSYFFIRIVDNVLHNFPNTINFDPYMLYPAGFTIITPPFLPLLVAGSILTFTMGAPSQTMADTIAVYIPAILGALTIIPVFIISKSLFNRWAGIIAAALVAIFPGEFMGRSILGFTDQHVAETFLSTTSAMFLILAINIVKNNPDIKTAWKENKVNFYKIIIYGILAGIFLGLYTITWYGALLFVLIFFIYFIIQQIINHVNKIPLTSFSTVSSLTFLVTLLIFLVFSQNMLMILPLLIAVFLPLVLNVFSVFINRYKFKPFAFPVIILVSAIVAAVCFYFINPSVFNTLVANLNIFMWPRNSTILEMQPILFPNNVFSINALWGNFTTGFFISLIAIGFLIFQIIKKRDEGITFLLVWTIVMLAATLSMRRYAYYFIANVAILSGYISWLGYNGIVNGNNRIIPSLIWFAITITIIIICTISGLIQIYPDFIIAILIAFIAGIIIYYADNKSFKTNSGEHGKLSKASKKVELDKARKQRNARVFTSVLSMLTTFSILIAIILPNRVIAENVAGGVYFAPSNAWCESLTWLKNNTPDPFDNDEFYYEYYKRPSPGEKYQYPSTAYSIASWWDYGYWITRIAHRIPISNPGTNHNGEAFYFMSNNADEANKKLTNLNSKYVIINDDMVMPNSKFHALASLSNNDVYDFVDVYYTEENGKFNPQIYFSTRYYQSLVVRLYNFDGKKVEPSNIEVITYSQRKTTQGQIFKLITAKEIFGSYEKAIEYASKFKTEDKTAIVGSNPFSSPVPLEELTNYKLVHNSDIRVTPVEGISIPEVKIFEYSK